MLEGSVTAMLVAEALADPNPFNGRANASSDREMIRVVAVRVWTLILLDGFILFSFLSRLLRTVSR